jgi:hypothetical protein
MKLDAKTEVPQLTAASSHFQKAKAAFDQSAASCKAFRANWTDDEKLALMDRDIKGFQHMSGSMEQLVSEMKGDKIPTMETVHQVMSDIGDTLTYAKYRAQAHRGMKGHYPK